MYKLVDITCAFLLAGGLIALAHYLERCSHKYGWWDRVEEWRVDF